MSIISPSLVSKLAAVGQQIQGQSKKKSKTFHQMFLSFSQCQPKQKTKHAFSIDTTDIELSIANRTTNQT